MCENAQEACGTLMTYRDSPSGSNICSCNKQDLERNVVNVLQRGCLLFNLRTCRNSLFQGLVALCMMASYCSNEKELHAYEVGRVGIMAH